MRGSIRNTILKFIGVIAGVMLMNVVLVSCENIYEDLAPCPHGVSLRFVYNYNMEYADAFHKKVDCLTLLVYDGNGKYVDARVVTGAELQDEKFLNGIGS